MGGSVTSTFRWADGLEAIVVASAVGVTNGFVFVCLSSADGEATALTASEIRPFCRGVLSPVPQFPSPWPFRVSCVLEPCGKNVD